jgi:hypothetical protein
MTSLGKLAIAVVIVALAGCGGVKKETEGTTKPVATIVPAGTEVRLAILTTITSGGTPVGERVPLAVLEDVKDQQGRTVISAGTIAWAKVTRSRGATTFTAIANQPARLEIQFESATAVDGSTVPLCFNVEEPEASMQLSRKDSSHERAETGLQSLLSDPKVEQALMQFGKMLESGEKPDLLDDAIRSALNRATTGGQVPDEQSVERLSELLKQARSGNVGNLAPSDVLLAIATAQQVVRLVDQAGDKLAGMLKGANIKIWAGTPLTARVARETTVTLRPASGRSTR